MLGIRRPSGDIGLSWANGRISGSPSPLRLPLPRPHVNRSTQACPGVKKALCVRSHSTRHMSAEVKEKGGDSPSLLSVEEKEEEKEGESREYAQVFPPGTCPGCGRESIMGGCNGQGRIQGGIGALPGFGWLPIKAYRPCPSFVEAGGKYRRQGQSLDEVAFGRKGPDDDLDVKERLAKLAEPSVQERLKKLKEEETST